MPTFIYHAKKGPENITRGIVHALSLEDAITKIIQSGFMPVDVILNKEGSDIKKRDFYSFRKISHLDVLMFTRYMADLIDASVPILSCLETIKSQIKNFNFKVVVNAIYEKVQNGFSLSESLRYYSKIFPSFYIEMIEAAEQSAQLDKVLGYLVSYLEKEEEFQNKIRLAVAYPSLIFSVGVITVFVLLIFVIPRVAIIFEDMHQGLPLMTRAVLNLSHFFAHFWWSIVFILLGASFYLKKCRISPQAYRKIDFLKIQIPFLGDFFKKVQVSHFCRHVGILVKSGVSMVEAMASAQTSISNSIFKEQINNAVIQIKDGVSLKESLMESSFFSEMALSIIVIGEEIGNQQKGFLKVADMYEKDIDRTAKQFVSLLGPIVLIVVVVFVGCFVVAMVLPILQMNLILP